MNEIRSITGYLQRAKKLLCGRQTLVFDVIKR